MRLINLSLTFLIMVTDSNTIKQWLLKRGRSQMLLNNYKGAEDIYLNVYRLDPGNPNAAGALCRLYNIKQDWESLLTYSKFLIDKKGHSLHESGWDKFYIQSLIGLHENKKAEKYFLSIIDTHDCIPEKINIIVDMATKLRIVEKINIDWEMLINKYPTNIAAHTAYANYLINIGDYGRLKSYCNLFKENSSLYMPVFKCFMAMRRFEDARRCIEISESAKHKKLKYYLDIALHSLRSWNYTGMQESLNNLLKQEISHPYSLNLKIKLITLCIRLNNVDSAISRIDALNPWLENRKDVSELKSWRYNVDGHHDISKNISMNLIRQHYFESLHSPISIERRDKRNMTHCKDDILLFSPMKNCLNSLPWFLNHYRNMGVKRFFIIDNNSDDGTHEYLLDQPDVYLFHSKDSFAMNNSGMRWINYLITEYAGNSWCVFVDVDEALVFPGMEKLSLKNLLNYMDKNNHELMSAFMLDMYPDNIKTLESCHNVSERIEKSIFFDNDYQFLNSSACPYKAIRGGVRSRLFGTNESLQKVPIIKGGRGISYINNHSVSSGICTDITAALLHYNIPMNPQLLDSEWLTKNDTTTKSRMPICKLRYGVYSDINLSFNTDFSYLYKKSVKYESSQQLVDLGFMNAPDRYIC